MFRSATFKLTMWYLAIVMAISLVFSVALYHVTTGELQWGLSHETQRIYTQFPVFQDNPLLRPTADYNTSAHRILLRLVGFNVIVLAFAGGASYWLAKRTLEPIEESHEQQKRFTSDVSHELRTPLTALRMESEVALLNDKTTAQELRQTLKSNLEEVGKLEAIINNLLRLTRLEVEELQQSFVTLQAEPLIIEAIDQVKAMADAKNIAITHSGDKANVSGDKNSLVQLLVVLLDNAVKYSPKKSEISVVVKKRGEWVEISVHDSGSGIEPTALEHIFDRFYRADDSRQKEDKNGFGLGLSIAKMIADLHQGSIIVHSQPGKGTTATLNLSLVPVTKKLAQPKVK